MGAYIGRRLLTMIPTLVGVSLLLFVIFNVVGDDPVYLYLGKSATQSDIDAMRRALGLDKPLWLQYLIGMKDLVTLNWGFSMSAKKPIMDMFLEGVGPSIARQQLRSPASFAASTSAVATGRKRTRVPPTVATFL